MLSYATIQEAFSVPSIHRTPNKKLVKKERENFTNPLDSQAQATNQCFNSKQFHMEMPGCQTIDSKDANTCAPLSAPPYTIPISPESKNRADEAMKNFLMQQNINKPIKSNLDKLQSYSEDDMDMYLDISDYNKQPQDQSNNPPPEKPSKPPASVETYNNSQTDFKIDTDIFKGITQSPPPKQKTSNDFSDIYIELFIFLLVGILVISMCEMIVRIATN